MKIISGFRDYYDSIKSFGIDKTVVYNRKEERMLFKAGPEMYASWSFNNGTFKATRIIGFCGKLYPLLQTPKSLIYDRKEALKRVKESWYEKEVNACFSEDIKNPALLKIFAEKNTPVFIYGDYLDGKYKPGVTKELIINPKLKDWGFESTKDPVTAFQEIYMFISGVLGTPVNPMVKLSDKELAKKRGHGDKFSFRKPPGKRGNPKWR